MGSRKKVGLIAGAGLSAAAAVALRRRWAGEDDSAHVDEPGAQPGPAGNAFLRRLSEAIAIPTPAVAGVPDADRLVEFRGWLERSYPRTHESLQLELVADHTLLFTWPGVDSHRPPVVLMAHQDVVPVEPGTEDDWEYHAYSGEVANGFLHGRGALDDKASLVGIFEAVESLLVDGFVPEITIHLIFGHDEETQGSGADAVAQLFVERGVRPSLVLDEGGAVAVDFLPGISEPVALIGVAEKGSVDLVITAEGVGGHSSTPPPSTAIGKVAATVAAIEANPMPARLDVQRGLFQALGSLASGLRGALLRRPDRFGPILERRLAGSPTTNAIIRTTAAATMIDGGVSPNVLPQEASATINFRVMPGDRVADVIEHVRRLAPDDVTVETSSKGLASEPSAIADVDSAQYSFVASVIGASLPVDTVAPWVLTGATDSRFFVGIADQVLRFVPVTVAADDFSRFHGTGERIRTSDADAVVRFYRTFIERVGGFS